MTIADMLYTGSYNSLTVYIYDENEVDEEYKFYATVGPENVQFDGDTITMEVFTPLSHMEVVLPFQESDVIWDRESDSYWYTADGNRYGFYF